MAKRNGPVHVATITRDHKGKVYRTHLLRRTFREDGKVKHETLGNLSHLPDHIVDLIRRALRGEVLAPAGGWEILRAHPHGHVAAVLGAARRCGLEQLLAPRSSAERTRVLALIVARLIAPASKLATARQINAETAASSLGLELGLEDITEDELYASLDWRRSQQPRIEKRLAKKHLRDGTLVLYDVSSSYYTGRHCPLAAFGHNRDGKKGHQQIVYGLLCAPDGCPGVRQHFPAPLRRVLSRVFR
jgi:hypothetical protein